MTSKSILFAMGLVLAGCVDATELGEASQEVEAANGVSLNGVSMNGVSMNGVSMNGVSMNGVSMNGVSMNGVSMNGVSMNGVSMNGVSLDGASLRGVRSDTGETITIDAVGRTLTGLLSNGATIPLRIDSATALTGSNADVWSYGVSYSSDIGWSPLCGDPTLRALAVAGTWNTQSGVVGGGAYSASTSAFTFACRGKTIAKCVELGYKTWTGHSTQLQSCVRLLRGDYCGDGTPYTTTGQRVNLYDNVGIQADTEAWIAEAEWTPAGARCIATTHATRFAVSGVTPPCVAKRGFTTLSCGQGFKNAILISEVPPDILNLQVSDPTILETVTIITP